MLLVQTTKPKLAKRYLICTCGTLETNCSLSKEGMMMLSKEEKFADRPNDCRCKKYLLSS